MDSIICGALIIFLGIFLFFIVMVTLYNNDIYCRIHHSEDVKKWNEIIKNIGTFYVTYNKNGYMRFKSPLYPNEHLFYSKGDETISFHKDIGGGCILCSFDTTRSKKVLKLLREKTNLYNSLFSELNKQNKNKNSDD